MCRSPGLIYLGLRPLTAVRVRAPHPRAYHLSQHRSFVTSNLRYTCDVDAEPIYRYRFGGYHPVRLGDAFKQGRYKVLHKLGHGGFSTVWIARDQSLNQNVALKIVTSKDSSSINRELCTHRRLLENSVLPTNDHKDIVRLLDNFDHPGLNGTHICLVLELLGPSAATVIEERFASNRLPGSVAKKACKEMALALEVLHAQGIGHGDLHTGNVAFIIPGVKLLPEEELSKKLGKPKVGPVSRPDGEALKPGMPEYLVWPARLPANDPNFEKSSVKLIDFGESFMSDNKAETLHTPLALRAPEVLFQDEYDLRVDCWSLGCTMFELVVGQPPFSSLMAKQEDVLQQIADLIGEPPEKWQSQWKAMPKWEPCDDDGPIYTLAQWLDLLYFDSNASPDFTRQELAQFGRLISKLLQWDPCDRPTITEILAEEWLQDC
ncbi:kinase-like protein [Aureobasidium pullulans]|uniref:non-specific serine/threonine protein kinase n=1 Tax=Aureobasidium pullulans TaxID=5580 RepID=A0A4S8RXG2_AURPU|nr:kinase-like protein [Aureobasidium pullulans]